MNKLVLGKLEKMYILRWLFDIVLSMWFPLNCHENRVINSASSSANLSLRSLLPTLHHVYVGQQ